MPNLTTVHLTNGLPDSGTGTVSTIDNFLGIAGTPSTNVLSVQGITGGTGISISTGLISIATGTVTTVISTISNLATGNVSILQGGNTATVKGASSAPSATDPALVVAISPNGVNPNGQTTKSASAPVTLPSDMGPALPSSSFNRPANGTTYSGGNLVANSTTAGSVTPLSFTIAASPSSRAFVRGAKLQKSSTGTSNATFRVHLYGTSPTPSNGDGAAWLTGSSSYLGDLDINLSTSPARVFTDGVVGFGTPNASRPDIAVQVASGQTIYGLVEATAAYVGATSETITVTLDTYQS